MLNRQSLARFWRIFIRQLSATLTLRSRFKKTEASRREIAEKSLANNFFFVAEEFLHGVPGDNCGCTHALLLYFSNSALSPSVFLSRGFFLYSPDYLYGQPAKIKNNNASIISIPSDRFATVNQWYINTKRVRR